MVPGVVKLGMMPSDKKGQLCLVVSDRGDVRTLCSLLFWKIKAFYVFIFQSPLILIYYQFETKKRWLMAWKIRSSHQRCSVRKGVPRNFAKLSGKHLCQRLFFNKVAGLGPASLSKRRLWRRCFLVNFAKFLRTPLFTEQLWWMLQYYLMYFSD